MARGNRLILGGCKGAAAVLLLLLLSFSPQRADAKAFPGEDDVASNRLKRSTSSSDDGITDDDYDAVVVGAADGTEGGDTIPVAGPGFGTKATFKLWNAADLPANTSTQEVGPAGKRSGTSSTDDAVVTEADGDGTNVNGTIPVADADDFGEVAGPRLPLGTGSDSETLVGSTGKRSGSSGVPKVPEDEKVVIVDPYNQPDKKSSGFDNDVFIVEAISVSVSDRNLPTHAPPAVEDPEAFGLEPQPRLPLFHDDEDYYEVDLGDDEFVVVEAAGDRAVAGGRCSLDKDEGQGGEEFERFYYAEDDGECRKFVYKGEGGNDNRFTSETACLSECGSPTQVREISAGCFSSPPKDCGAGCVASFRQDDSCYECCCQENPVNATSCALPPASGRCRGNFERWAFNEATGDCEKFAYGGCGGNANRFMCKEMCMSNCANP